ncbi:MAG: hypothetical protein R3Y44_06245 [Rikenellaceae bacterium]
MKKIIALLSVCLLITSCSTIRTASSTSVDVTTNVVQYPVVVDLDISTQMVTKEVSWTYVESLFKSTMVKKAESTIIYDMLKECDADVLVEKRVQTIAIPFGRKTVSIMGYPAKFTNFRKLTNSEIRAIEAVNCNSNLYFIDENGSYKLVK